MLEVAQVASLSDAPDLDTHCFSHTHTHTVLASPIAHLYVSLQRYGGRANAVPHYQKFRIRASHVWGDRRLQLGQVQCTVSTWRNRLLDHGIPYAR